LFIVKVWLVPEVGVPVPDIIDHEYKGEVPPPATFDAKLTLLLLVPPLHEVWEIIDGTIFPVTVIVIAFDVAVVGLAQGALEVMTQVMISPLTRVVIV
jgi:hypothetical protein